MEMLSEHQCQGWLEGYLLTGRHGFFSCYEAFIHIIDSMFNQHAKWLKVCNHIPWRRPIASLNYLLSSHVWRQDHNGFSHQDPGFIDHVVNKKAEVVRVYLPPDANCLLSVTDHCLRSRNYVNVVVAGKQPAPVWLTMDEAIKHCTAGIGIWEWASNDKGGEPDVVMACCGDVPTLETLAAVDLLRQHLPELKVRVINVVNLMKLQPPSEHPHGLSDHDFDTLFTKDKPIVFAFHGYPWLIHRLTYRRTNHKNLHVRGYKEEGTTTTPFDMVVLNEMDRFHLVQDVIDRLPQLGSRAAYAKQAIRDALIEHRQLHQRDAVKITHWSLAGDGARRGRPRRDAAPRKAITSEQDHARGAETTCSPGSTADRSALVRRGRRALRTSPDLRPGHPGQRGHARDKFEAVARSIRDVLSQRWLKTEQTYQRAQRQAGLLPVARIPDGPRAREQHHQPDARSALARILQKHAIDPLEIIEQEPDAGLGNGGLGRLAACFLDSMATLGIPGMGSGPALRVRHLQAVHPRRLAVRAARSLAGAAGPVGGRAPERSRRGAARPARSIFAAARCGSFADRPSTLIGMPYDRPVIGYGGKTINTLRLWSAATPDYLRFPAVQQWRLRRRARRDAHRRNADARALSGRFDLARERAAVPAAILPRRLHAGRRGPPVPRRGQRLACAAGQMALQLNDTHPTLAVPELMRILLDDAKLGWDEAWDLTQRTLAYTNHTLLPEALEKWPLPWFEMLLPRQLEIIYEINRRFLDEVRGKFPGRRSPRRAREPDRGRRRQEGPHGAPRHRRLAQHQRRRRDSFGAAEEDGRAGLRGAVPGAFNNKTNGVTQRRFLLLANPALAAVITDAIGDGWIPTCSELEKLKPLADDTAFPRRRSRGQARGQGAFRRLAASRPRASWSIRDHLRHADQAHPRIQAATAERAAHRRALPRLRRIQSSTSRRVRSCCHRNSRLVNAQLGPQSPFS